MAAKKSVTPNVLAVRSRSLKQAAERVKLYQHLLLVFARLMSIQHILDELNPQQRRAATTNAANTLLLAGAGSGKTKTIVARAAYLISQGVPAKQIQIVTFTRRAASEIVTRVQLYLGDQAQGLSASTFHTFCLAILRRYSQAFSLGAFSVIDRDDQLLMLRLLRGKQPAVELPKAQQLLDLYSYSRNTQSTFSQAFAIKMPDMQPLQAEIAQLLQAYEQQKQQRGYLDYDDILQYVASYLQQSPALLAQVLTHCQYLLVDEMQDSNPLQWSLLQPFIGKAALFCVGDDAQSIYAFRGADFQNIHAFGQRVVDAQIMHLSHNYRSTQEILDLSNWLLKISPLAYNKQLHAQRGQGCMPHMHSFNNEFAEAQWIAEDLKQRYQQGAAWREHMILVRSAYSGRSIESALVAAEIPYQFIGGVKLLESAHIKDLLSALRIRSNHKDELAWMRYLTLWNGIGDVSASRMAAQFLACTELSQCLAKLQTLTKLPAEAIAGLKQLLDVSDSVTDSIDILLTALEAQLAANYKNQDWPRRKRDFELLKQLADKHSSIAEFLEEYVLEPISHSEVAQQQHQDLVSLITIHSAKGTEREVCYVANASVGQFPHARAQGDFDQVEEERRVLYVALTRAQNELIITRQNLTNWAKDHCDPQGRPVSSYFFNDLPEALCRQELHHQGAISKKSWRFEDSASELPRIGIDWS